MTTTTMTYFETPSDKAHEALTLLLGNAHSRGERVERVGDFRRCIHGAPNEATTCILWRDITARIDIFTSRVGYTFRVVAYGVGVNRHNQRALDSAFADLLSN